MRIINRERERKKKKIGCSDQIKYCALSGEGWGEKKRGKSRPAERMASSYSAALNEKFALSGQIFTVLESTRNETIFSAHDQTLRRTIWTRHHWAVHRLSCKFKKKKREEERKRSFENFRSVYLKYNFLKNILTPGNLHHLSTIVYIYILVPNKTILSTFVGSIYVEVIELFEGSTRLGITARVVEKKF